MPIETEQIRVDRQWKKSKKYAEAFNYHCLGLVERAKIFQDALALGVLPDLEPWISDFQELQRDNDRLQKIIRDVELGKLGLRESIQKSGDIDVMAPPGTSNDIVADYQLGWVLLVIGIVVAVGLVAIFAYKTAKANQLEHQYKPLYNYCDSKLRGNPEWEQKKRSVFVERQTTWQKFEKAAKKIIGGAGAGLAIAIPIIGIIVASSWVKK